MTTAPIIITGMHRSGTTMLSKIISEMGVYQGSLKDVNNESVYFMNINKWIFSLAGASWDNPTPLKVVENDPNLIQVVQDRLQFYLNSFLRYRYFGSGSILSRPSFFQMTSNWGWKDPRNTFTLPFWLRTFPSAKVIHLTRHGVDVANSLVTREKKITSGLILPGLSYRNKLAALFFPVVRGSVISSYHCQNLQGAFHLWSDYMNRGEEMVERYKDRILSIRYESIFEEPKSSLKIIENHLQIKLPENKIDTVISRLNRSRSYAYKKNPELELFADSVSRVLNKYGYK